MRHDCFPDSPADWPKGVFSELAVVNPRYVLDGRRTYPFLEMASVAENFGGVLGFEQRPADSSGLVRFRKNDILFGKITPCAENGKVALVSALPDEFGLGSTEFVVLSPKTGHVPRFVYALACSGPVHGRAVSRMEGSTGRLRITEDVFTKWLVVPLPPPDEQVAIARILDASDTAIERARVAVEKAERVRTSLLQASFTFGKRADHDLKPSRLGRIPHTWDAVKGKAAFEIITGGNSSVGALRFSAKQGTDAWFMKVDDFNLPENTRTITCSQIGFSTSMNPSFTTVPVGSLVIAKRGAAILKNRVRVTSVPVALDPNLMAIGPKPGVCGRFLRYQLEWRNLSRYVESSGLPQINNKDLYPRWFLKAPPEDQERIVSILDSAHSVIEVQEIRLAALERLKRGLMQDLLTGRVRVKTAASALAATV